MNRIANVIHMLHYLLLPRYNQLCFWVACMLLWGLAGLLLSLSLSGSRSHPRFCSPSLSSLSCCHFFPLYLSLSLFFTLSVLFEVVFNLLSQPCSAMSASAHTHCAVPTRGPLAVLTSCAGEEGEELFPALSPSTSVVPIFSSPHDPVY